ncbi:hypothetical protein BDN71DRAFT_1429525 [Pleurotus eryngii]|uniref:Uncharacterized protein n=1 Tax=Pleurotus eryngii TaxID=5323 RepID=A0A9P6A1Z6_PLEER|nr:hypothetical protein BDN71DRAFT_1429525 [Pleurotus eryngii]
MTGNYIVKLLRKKAQHLLVLKYPWILDILDACHNLHNTIKDICNLEVFKLTITSLHDVLAFMSLSTYTLDHFDDACKKLGIGCGLEGVGETQFETVYWSLKSLIRSMDALKKVVHNKKLAIESKIFHKIFDDNDNIYKFTKNA